MSKKHNRYSAPIPTINAPPLPPRRRVSAIDRITRDFIAIQKTSDMHRRYLLLYNLCIRLEALDINFLEIECVDHTYNLSINHYFDWVTTYDWQKPIIAVRSAPRVRTFRSSCSNRLVWDWGTTLNIFTSCYVQQCGIDALSWQRSNFTANNFGSINI